jgi:hypothetical protein
LPVAVAFDAPPKRIAQSFAKFLPLASKVFIDGTYLRAMFGSLWILLSLAAATVGLIGVSEVHEELALPSAAIVSTLIAIGVFDVFDRVALEPEASETAGREYDPGGFHLGGADLLSDARTRRYDRAERDGDIVFGGDVDGLIVRDHRESFARYGHGP